MADNYEKKYKIYTIKKTSTITEYSTVAVTDYSIKKDLTTQREKIMGIKVPELLFPSDRREFLEETNYNHRGVNPADLSCLRLDLSPAAVELVAVSEGGRRTLLVRGNESSTCCRRNVMVQTVRSFPPGSSGIWTPVKFPLFCSGGVQSSLSGSAGWRIRRCLIQL